jgi:alanyl-tRNA synthetase
MESRSSREIRSEFLRYFEEQGHRTCSSYPLVPPNDPTLLFTNAGMVQFKDVFTGKEQRDFKRAASSQKCVRAGGKHNDLENVGFTARHHTFFEMLGNFSFGDYFKKDAVRYGWEFLVDWMKLPADRLWVTVFEGDSKENLPADDEAAALWQSEVGVPQDRILRFGKADNFWSMGEVGPCGPCSEIHYDQGDSVPCNQPGGCRGIACECDRYLEVWNLVFMQFERDAAGRLSPLPAPSIDTGMGLERLAALVQGVNSNYKTDLFVPLITRMGEIAGVKLGTKPETDTSLRVIADHARATAFLMADGVLPSNEGRGYVLRRIMRRAIRHGNKLGVDEVFFHEICLGVVEMMSAAYPELNEQQTLIEKATRLEEETFRRTLTNGLKILKKEIASLKERNETLLPGKLVFDLQTRDGFPPDLTGVIAREHGLTVDEATRQKAFEHHQQISAGNLGLEVVDEIYPEVLGETGATEFTGYEETEGQGTILALLALGDKSRSRVEAGETGETLEAVISPTPFYGETGGQVGDTGLTGADGFRGEVLHTSRPLPDLIVHRIKITDGRLKVGDRVQLSVDTERRQAIRLNHSATHLLQAALRKVLGRHVNQQGSMVAPDRFRFDFPHFAPMTREEIRAVETDVNRRIRQNLPVEVTFTDVEGARKAGATMLFGEKYGERVRMVRMGDSLELCGGTHSERTGDIGVFKIVSEGSIKAGVRRIEAVTGAEAIRRFQSAAETLGLVVDALKIPQEQLLERVQALVGRERKLAKEIEGLKQLAATAGAVSDPTGDAREIAGVKVLATRATGIQLAGLRDFADRLRDKLGTAVVLAFAEDRGKLSAVCSISKDLTKRLKAGDLLKQVFALTGGKGGGRPDFAQGGGGDPALMDKAISEFYPLVERALSNQ